MHTEAQSSSNPSARPSDSTPTAASTRAVPEPAVAADAAPTPQLASAFSEVFLGQLRRIAAVALDRGRHAAAREPATQREAILSGPFSVETVERPTEGPGHALLRPGEDPQPYATPDGPAAVLERRDEALRLAAVLPALAEAPLHEVSTKRHPRGVALHQGSRFLGHLGPAASRLSDERRHTLETHLDLARYLASHPHALALLLESVGAEALPLLGRALARRVEALLPG